VLITDTVRIVPGDEVDRDSPVPLAEQLAAILRREIAAGRLRGRIPGGEPALAERYGVSRDTVRRAFAVLIEEGLLVVSPSRGTFVVRPEDRPGNRQ
jgi:DNA-binding GntR family transcriptional regulator